MIVSTLLSCSLILPLYFASSVPNPFQANKAQGAMTAAGFPENSKVLPLTDADFDLFVDGSVPVFVDFYSPTCGYCRALAPEMERVAEAYSRHKEQLIIARVDCSKERGLVKRFSLTGFPTLLYFHKGSPKHPIKYRASRTAEEISIWIEAQSGIVGNMRKPSRQFKIFNSDDLRKAISNPDKMFFIEFTMPTSGHCKRFESIWGQLADLYENETDLVIAQVDVDVNRELVDEFKIQAYPTMIFFPKGINKEPIPYSDYWILESLVMFLNDFTKYKRRADGTLAKESGIMKEFDDKIKAFLATSSEEDRSKIISQVSNYENNVSDPLLHVITRYYVKVMEKIDGLGTDFIVREVSRLSGLIASQKSSLTLEKWEEIQIKRNILKQFAIHAKLELPSDEPKSYMDDMPKLTEVPKDEKKEIKEKKQEAKEVSKEDSKMTEGL